MDMSLRRRAHRRAAQLGVSFAEYVRRVIAADVGEVRRKPDVAVLFDLVTDDPTTDIARDKARMIADAVHHEHLRKTGGKAGGKARRQRRR